MKCPHCGGSLLFEPGLFNDEPALKCMACGRRVFMDEQKRRCLKCKKEYPLTAEYFHRMGDGFVYYCKPCRSKMQKGYKRKSKVSSVVPVPNKNRRFVQPVRKPIDSPRNLVTRATPEEIIAALRKGVAEEIIQTVRERFGL